MKNTFVMIVSLALVAIAAVTLHGLPSWMTGDPSASAWTTDTGGPDTHTADGYVISTEHNYAN